MERSMKRRKPRSRRGFRCESFLLGLNLVLLPVAARADIVADGSAPANQQPTVLNAGNGVPLVNIQTPSAAGVSRNTYSQFDVNSNGAILNNSRTDTQTQLGGWVQGNPQLATGSARVILNEVNANDPSRLNGYVEVAGSSAQVVIANPAGISCDGCGFINANRATLSTGTPILNNGALEGYRVDGGQIQINGAGLNAGSAGYTDLIGQAVQVNAGVWAQRLNVVAGAGQVNADASGIAANPSSEDVPVVAIDVSQLGGMYANSIHLVGTDAGVGVRNAGQIGAAAGEVVITADGRLENIGVVSAAQVQASANAISNGASGELNGQQLNLQASGDFENQGAIVAQYLKVDAGGPLNNRGLINSNTTQLRSDTLNNTGTGRIYGDTVAIGATTFNNVAQGDTAPVMAARERLDIGAQTINNREHGLIYSSGDMAIGGSLDANNRAIGQADTLNNISATVQADGNLDLGIRTVNNINAHLTTDDVQVSSEFIHEYGGEGSPNRYSPAEISFVRHDQSRDLRTPDGVYSAWYEFQYQRTVTETQVVTSDPGQILAGGNLRLNTGTVTNDNSQILAGGDLTGTTDSINNIQHEAQRVVSDNGVSTRYTRVKEEDAGGSKDHWEQRKKTTSYSPVGTVTHPDGLGLARSEGGQVIAGNDTQLPDNSLYNINPSAPNGYLVETDPRFTDYRNWISSDYMLQQLAVDPAMAQMRLGDGFYEQQRVREQLAQLTGRRFLDGYSDDETQYVALLDAGVTFAQAHELRPGVELTAEQIAQLTSDIVWLVEQTVTLADGSTEKVLVPQLYVRVRDNSVESGLSGDGALITANNIQLDMRAGLNNSGTIAGRRVTALTAENIDNVRGTLQGQDVQLTARNDINNLGGSVRAQDSLNVTAGHDINVVSTTVTNSNAQGTRTNIDRVAGLYVQSGSLKANAGHDINLSGAAIVNDTLTLDANRLGNTELIAGNDFMLNSVQENEQQKIVWSPGTYRSDSSTQQAVSSVQSSGNVLLQAGRDLKGVGANVASTQGTVELAAARDLQLEAGVNETHIEGRGQTNRSRTDITRHTVAGVSAGDNVAVRAGGDLTLRGAALQSTQGDVQLQAAGDTHITAVVDTEYHYDREKQKGSFGRSESSTDETLDSTVVGGTLVSGGDTLINAHKNSQGEIISEQSGNVTLTGVRVQSQGDIAIAADEDINVTGVQSNHLDYHQSQSSGLGGLSKKDEGQAATEARLHNAQLASGGDTHILSGRDMNLIAANVTANGDVNLEAVDQLLIAAGQTLSNAKQWKNESRAFSSGHLYEMHEYAEGETVTGAQASTLTAGGTVTARAGNGRVIGSDIHGEQGVDLRVDAGDFIVEAAQASRSHYVHEKEVTVSLGDAAAKGAVNPALLVQTNDGRLTVHLADAEYRESDTQSTSTTMRSAQISSGGDVNIDASAGSINIIGSNLASDTNGDNNGDINLSAAQNISITEAIDTASSESKTTTGDAEVSLVVQNEAVEVVKAYERLEDAKEQLEDSKRQYKDYERNLDQLEQQLSKLEKDYTDKKPGVTYEDLVELRTLVEDVKDDEKWYQAGIALAAANLVSATTGLIQQTATAAASTATYGFNAGLQLDIDATKSSSEVQSSTAVASNLSGQNIRIATGANGNAEGTKTNIQGSQLLATDKININTGDLNVTASKNTRTSSNETEQGHITAQMTVYGAAGGASVNANFNRSQNSAKETTYNNSFLLADNIDLKTSGDVTLRGATVRAESELNADIGGNLTVESVQNRSSSRNSSAGISGGFSLGGTDSGNDHVQGAENIAGLSGVNGGANTGTGMSNTRQTVLTSLTSGGIANINVQNHTQITGALIGSTDDNDQDLNKLNFSTGTFGFTDLRDSSVSSQTSGGISTNLGISGPSNTAINNTGGELLPGTTNITYSNSQQNSARNQLATLGHGTIRIGGATLEQNGELTEAGKANDFALVGINRDTTDTTKELWSSDYTQDADVTIDNRLVTKDGRNQIRENAEDGYEFGQDIGRATNTILDEKDLNASDFWTTLTNNAVGTQIKNELSRNPEYSELLAALKSQDGDTFAQAFKELGLIAQRKFGLTPDQFGDIFLYDGDITTSTSLQNRLLSDTLGGTVLEPSNPEYGNIAVNATSGKKSEMVNTLGHEALEVVALRTNGKNDASQEAQANAFGAQFSDRINQALGGDIDSTSGSTFNIRLQNSVALAQGTVRANTVASARVDNRALANIRGQAAVSNLRAQGIEIEAKDIKTQMIMGVEESSTVGSVTRALAVAGQCQAIMQCQNMATRFVDEAYGGAVLNDLGGGLLVPASTDDPAIGREVALQFLGDNFRELLSQNPELDRNFTERLAHPVQGVVDLREYYAIAFSYSMNKEAAKAGLIPGDFAQTASEAIGATAWNTLNLAGRWELAGALNDCTACPQDMPQAHNRLVELLEIGSELALLRGVAAVGNFAVDGVGSLAMKADKMKPDLRNGIDQEESLVQTHNSNLSAVDWEFGRLAPNATVSNRSEFKDYVSKNNLTFKDGWAADRVYDEVVNVPGGSRPNPSVYMSDAQIGARLSAFDEGAVRFTSRSNVEKYGTAGSSDAFVLPKKEFDRIVEESKGDLRLVEKRLGLDQNYLGGGDTMAVYIKPQDIKNIRIPSGREGGANSQWVPGGRTNGGVSEAVVDLSDAPFSEISIK